MRTIVQVSHAHKMLVLVDEAHGTHLYFGENLPVCAMDAGVDMASVSMHKRLIPSVDFMPMARI